jgi:hypothetical protein
MGIITMKRFIMLSLLVVFCFFGKNIYAVDASRAYVDIFDSFCMQNGDNFSQIDKMAKGLGLKKIPKKIQEGDPVLARKGGNGYLMFKDGNAFLIAYANNGACTVGVRKGNVNKIRKILLKNYKVKKISSQDEGMQVTEMYSFTDDSLYKGGVVWLSFEKDAVGSGVVRLSYAPRRIVPPDIALEIADSLSVSRIAKKESLSGIFNNVCLRNRDDISETKKSLKAYGFFETPKSIAQGFPITHSYNGKIYALHNDNKIYLAGINNKGVCEIITKYTNPSEIVNDIENRFGAKFITNTSCEGFLDKLYQISDGEGKKDSMLVVRYLPNSNPNGLLIRYVPSTLNKKAT